MKFVLYSGVWGKALISPLAYAVGPMAGTSHPRSPSHFMPSYGMPSYGEWRQL